MIFAALYNIHFIVFVKINYWEEERVSYSATASFDIFTAQKINLDSTLQPPSFCTQFFEFLGSWYAKVISGEYTPGFSVSFQIDLSIYYFVQNLNKSPSFTTIDVS